MTNIFKPYPTHFSRGGRTILRSPWLRVCLCILRKCCYIHNAIVVQRSCHFDLWRTGHLAYFGSRRAIFAFGSKNVGSRRVARHLLRKKAKPRLKKAKPGKKSKLLNNTVFKENVGTRYGPVKGPISLILGA